jgi:serine/threonine protein kinase
MATNAIPNPNEVVHQFTAVSDALRSDDPAKLIKELEINWETSAIRTQARLVGKLVSAGLATDTNDTAALTRLGLLFFSRISIDFQYALKRDKPIGDKYVIEREISVGKNSATFVARHRTLGSRVVLKVVRPGAAENFVNSVQKIVKGTSSKHLVQPFDYFTFSLLDVFGNPASVDCIVFPFVDGATFNTFLRSELRPLNAHFVAAYIKQVGGVLAELERIGAYHGDLHEENILVEVAADGDLRFKLIDVSFGLIGSRNAELCVADDRAAFRKHLWRILSVQQQYLPKMSMRKYLGAKLFLLVSAVLNKEDLTFESTVNLLDKNIEYDSFLESKNRFLTSKFSAPGPFKLLRYEEITDHAVARELFEPFPGIFNGIKEFGNTYVSGNRGSGKSTYLASLAFFPKVTEPIVPFKEIFGIYFPCRQGEFRLLSEKMISYEGIGAWLVRHVLMVKIARRAIEVLSEALDSNKVSAPMGFDKIKAGLARFVGSNDIFASDRSVVSDLRNILDTLVRIEMKELDLLFGHDTDRSNLPVGGERNLVWFFQSIRLSFPELSEAQFYLLFDDAGSPNIPYEAQKLINDLAFSSNSFFCVKFSAERNTYCFETTEGKQLQEGNDYSEYDISRILFIGAPYHGLSRPQLDSYFRAIVRRRLRYFEFQSDNIEDYVGDGKIKHEQLINSLATGRKNAMYCGWTMIWHIADRTPRSLLEIVSEIFAVASIDRNTMPQLRHVPNRQQNTAILRVSEKRLRSLLQISGSVLVLGKKVSLGKVIYDITLAIGSAYQIYLKEEKGKGNRKRQHLAIERNDMYPLSAEAALILDKLVTYGVFDESRLQFSRDDEIKKPIYVLNRIFCPAFGISMQRDEHLRLSKQRFEQLLLEPARFVREGTKRLRQMGGEPVIRDMFEAQVNGN